MNITDEQAGLFTDLLYDALVEGEPAQWSDYEATFATFLQIASRGRLEAYGADTVREREKFLVAHELRRRDLFPAALAPLSWEERARVDSGKPLTD